MAEFKDLTLQQKLDNQDRINGVFKPEISNNIPPKAVNSFSDGTSPESLGSGQMIGVQNSGIGNLKWDNEHNRIIVHDGIVNRVVIGNLS